MKKILSLVMVIAMICALAVTTSAAELPADGLVGHFKLDGTLVNEVNGEEALPMTAQFGEGLYEIDERTWFAGPDGYAFCSGDGDGFNTFVNPGDGDFSFGGWFLTTSVPGYVPYIWYGPTNQSPENWVAIWNVNVANGWTTDGLTFGSNNAAGSRPEFVPEDAAKYDKEVDLALPWTHAVITGKKVEADDGTSTFDITMYVNGVNVGSVSGAPNPYSGDPETNGDYVYVNGVNAWADNCNQGAIDDVIIYSRALTDDEVAAIYASYTEVPTYASADEFYATMTDLSGDSGEDEPVETEAPETEAPETEAPATEAPTTEAPAADTEAPAEEGGCGSAMGAAALVALVATLGCAIVKKH